MNDNNSNPTADDKVINRIRKMLRLANNEGASEGERDNAMRMALATLAKYNLDLSQVEVDTGKKNEEEKRERNYADFLGKPWAVQITGAIARLYFCSYYYMTLRGQTGQQAKARHVFIGRQSNVAAAREIAMYIVDSVHKEAQRYARSVGGKYQEYRAFAQGAAAKIYWRCEALRKEATQPAVTEEKKAPGTALVLADVYEREEKANNDFLSTLGVKLGKGRSTTLAMNANARAAGAQYGSSVALRRELGNR